MFLNRLTAFAFVEINLQRATAMSEAMDDVLGRVKVVVPKGLMVEAIRTEIRGQLEKLDTAENGAATVADRLHRAISEEGRSADVGMAGRVLREFVVANLISPAGIKKLTPFETTQELRKLLVAEWIISYLNLLHAFGNEAATTRRKTHILLKLRGMTWQFACLQFRECWISGSKFVAHQ